MVIRLLHGGDSTSTTYRERERLSPKMLGDVLRAAVKQSPSAATSERSDDSPMPLSPIIIAAALRPRKTCEHALNS